MKRKRIRYKLLMVVLLFCLTGCQKKSSSLFENLLGQSEPVQDKADGKNSEDMEEQGNQGESKTGGQAKEESDEQDGEMGTQQWTEPDVYVVQNFSNDRNGAVTLIKANYDTLKLDGEASPEFAAALAQYNQEAAAQVEQWKAEQRPYAEDDYSFSHSSFAGYEYEQEIRICRADKHVLSFAVEISTFTGGFHGDVYYQGKTFDVSTGKELTLEDVVTDTSLLAEIIVQELQKKYSEDDFFSGYQEQVALQFQPDSPNYYPPTWTVDCCGLVFYYANYELAPYSLGTLEVILPFAQYPDLFSSPYKEIPDEYALPMEQYQSQYVDVDGDGTLEEIYCCIYNSSSNGGGGSQVHIFINGNDTTHYTIDEMWFSMAYLMKLSDGTCYLYVNVDEIDVISEILVFYLGGRGAIYESTYGGSMEQRVFVTPGRFKLINHLDALSSCTVYKYYHVGNDGLPEPDDKAFTIMPYFDEYESEYCITAKIPVPVWMVQEDGSTATAPEQLPSGTKFYFRKTDGRSYVEMELEDGRHCQIRIDLSSWPRTINGMNEQDCFEGIMYAG